MIRRSTFPSAAVQVATPDRESLSPITQTEELFNLEVWIGEVGENAGDVGMYSGDEGARGKELSGGVVGRSWGGSFFIVGKIWMGSFFNVNGWVLQRAKLSETKFSQSCHMMKCTRKSVISSAVFRPRVPVVHSTLRCM